MRSTQQSSSKLLSASVWKGDTVSNSRVSRNRCSPTLAPSSLARSSLLSYSLVFTMTRLWFSETMPDAKKRCGSLFLLSRSNLPFPHVRTGCLVPTCGGNSMVTSRRIPRCIRRAFRWRNASHAHQTPHSVRLVITSLRYRASKVLFA